MIGEEFECGSDDGSGATKLFDEQIDIDQISIEINVVKMLCITATFSISNEKGHLESTPLSINLNKGFEYFFSIINYTLCSVNKYAPEINIETGSFGDLTVSLADSTADIDGPADIKVCYSRLFESDEDDIGMFHNNF